MSTELNIALAFVCSCVCSVQFNQFLGGVCLRQDGSLRGSLSTSMEYRIQGGNYSHLSQLWEVELVEWALQPRDDGISLSVFTPDS